jgi:hypothetical protein
MITGDSYIGSNRQHRLSDQVLAITKQAIDRSTIRFAARISAWRIAVVASTSTMIALSASTR